MNSKCTLIAAVAVLVFASFGYCDLTSVSSFNLNNPSQKLPCGLTGSTEERIKDCSSQESSANGSFVLVTRTENFKEVHKDIKSGLIWSDLLWGSDKFPLIMNYYDAEKACKPDLSEMGGLSSLTWRIPSINEYKEADAEGIRLALPNMNNHFYWSSSADQIYIFQNLLFDGFRGVVFRDEKYSEYSVRCVTR